jgi:hypothetical protein
MSASFRLKRKRADVSTLGPAIWSTLVVLVAALALSGCGVLGIGSPGEGEPLFADDFGDSLPGGWLLEGDAQGDAQIVDGSLLVSVWSPGTVHYATLENKVFSDLILDVEATQIAGAPGSSYGVLIGMIAPDQFYRFEVTSSGDFAVERHDGSGKWKRLTDGWQSSPAIKQGVNETNHLRVAAAGGTFSFYTNETLLTQVVDRSYATGAVALDAGTFNQSELQVRFDNLLIRSP